MRWTRSTSSEAAPNAAIGRGPAATRGGEGFWDSVRRLLPTVRVIMEFCWLYPWLVVIGGGLYGADGPLLSPVWTLGLLLGAQALVRPVVETASTLRFSRVALIAGGVILGLLAVHDRHYVSVPLWHPAWIGSLLRAVHDIFPSVHVAVTASLLAALLWWRGLAIGLREVGAIEIEMAYKTGVAMVVLYLIAVAVYADTQGFAAAGPDLPSSMLAFFFLGLSALALARLSTIWETGRPEERAQVPGRAWLLLVIGVVGSIMLVASTMAGLAAADISKYLVLALRPLMPVVEVVFVVLFFIASLIVRVLIAILAQLPQRQPREIGQPTTVIDDLLRRLRELEVNRQFVESARWGMALALLALLIIGMAVTIVLIRRRERKQDEDERESVWSARDALAALAGLLGGLRLRRATAGEAPGPEVSAIRRIYRTLLEMGASLGAPRKTWATPREHLPPLHGALPEAGPEVESLTWTYERVRYGRWRPTRDDVRAAEAALERARATVPPGAGAPTVSSEGRSK